MNKAPEYRVGIGASSILMIFIILSLTTLGVLSFASGRADLTLTTRRTEQVTAYHTATAQAQRLLSQIDAALLQARENPDTYDDSVKNLASLDETISIKRNGTIQLDIPVSDAQKLQVTLTANALEDAQRYTLTGHVLINIETWTPDNSIILPTS